ncbi:MAG: 3'-5' exonuclease [Firmicutes bacterium]|nr:3'-5' exonuclease [Bacillota bacterium]
MGRFIVFDVETPNSYNDRMSAIGVAVVENGVICDSFSALVDPETYFNSFNIALTGITPEAVCGAPTFPELWERLCPLFTSGVLAAHNAPFDMSVLAKCLSAYGFDEPRFLDYVCTVQMGRRVYPRLENHRLDTMCRHLDIPLDHHRAGSDAEACARLLIDYAQKGLVVEDYVRTYDTALCRTCRTLH